MLHRHNVSGDLPAGMRRAHSFGQAILTRYAGATDHHGARIIARCEGGRLILPWDYTLEAFENHKAAADLLADKLQWRGKLYGAGTREGYAFVCMTETERREG